MKAIVRYIFPDGSSRTSIHPDSAISRARDPFFVPDDSLWKVIPLHGARINRLGKAIRHEFAERYYSECLTASRQCRVEPDAFDVAADFGHDGAITVGDTVPAADVSPEARSVINVMIADLSRSMTLKTGDLILFGMCTDDNCPQVRTESRDITIEPSAGFPAMKLKIR